MHYAFGQLRVQIHTDRQRCSGHDSITSNVALLQVVSIRTAASMQQCSPINIFYGDESMHTVCRTRKMVHQRNLVHISQGSLTAGQAAQSYSSRVTLQCCQFTKQLLGPSGHWQNSSVCTRYNSVKYLVQAHTLQLLRHTEMKPAPATTLENKSCKS